jgi:hypothetical protein
MEARRRIVKGLEVRGDPSEPFAGRCGASIRARDTGKSGFCARTAGWGTPRKSWGRCRDHEGMETGLPPWFGKIPPETRALIRTGMTSPNTHGATFLTKASISEIFSKFLSDDEAAVKQLTLADPGQLLGVVMGIRAVGLHRITKWLHNERCRLKGVVTTSLLGAESSADRTAQTIARLAEARKGYLELEQKEEAHNAIRSLLQGLSDDEYSRLKADPHLLGRLMGVVSGTEPSN